MADLRRVVGFLIGGLVAPGLAAAGPESEIASAFDAGDGFDLHTSVSYRFSSRSVGIKRELSGLPGTDPEGTVPIVRDLVFASNRHEIVPRLELGVFTDLAISVELPVVIRDSRLLSLDPKGVNRGNSTTIGDGFVPEAGFDSRDPTGPGFADDTLFRGVDRAGLDQVHLGLIWAPMNQARDASKPVWKIGAEARLSVGTIATFDRVDPEGEAGVSRGVHEVKLWTSLARRRGWAEPFVELWWMAAFAERAGSPLEAPEQRFGAVITAPQQRGGARAGLEAIFFERPADRQRVSFDLEGRVDAHFEGRAYSEMWEVFALAGDASSGGPLLLDGDPVADEVQAVSHPGVTNVQNYLTLGGRAGVRAELGEKVRIGALFSALWDQAHFISFADAGSDLPTCGAGVTSACENDANDVVNQGTEEVNPLHADPIDTVGHRYLVNESRTLSFMVEARFLF
jgi:hypothetical protein